MNINLGLREIPNYIEGTACVPTAIAAITVSGNYATLTLVLTSFSSSGVAGRPNR